MTQIDFSRTFLNVMIIICTISLELALLASCVHSVSTTWASVTFSLIWHLIGEVLLFQGINTHPSIQFPFCRIVQIK